MPQLLPQTVFNRSQTKDINTSENWIQAILCLLLHCSSHTTIHQ